MPTALSPDTADRTVSAVAFFTTRTVLGRGRGDKNIIVRGEKIEARCYKLVAFSPEQA